MRNLIATITAAIAMGFPTAILAANDTFNLQYRVERSDSAKLSLDRCADITRNEAQAAGYMHSTDRSPGQLIVITGGPRSGGSSFIVHCIAVEDKTVSVVQALDYRNNAGTSAAFADRVHKALTAVSR